METHTEMGIMFNKILHGREMIKEFIAFIKRLQGLAFEVRSIVTGKQFTLHLKLLNNFNEASLIFIIEKAIQYFGEVRGIVCILEEKEFYP